MLSFCGKLAVQRGRYFVVLSLAEAETIRRIMHLRHDISGTQLFMASRAKRRAEDAHGYVRTCVCAMRCGRRCGRRDEARRGGRRSEAEACVLA